MSTLVVTPDELPLAQQFTRADWKELVANQSPSTVTGSASDANAIVAGVVSFDKLWGAIRFCLGRQYVKVDGSTYQLLRTDPVLHPRFPELICDSFDAQPIAPNGALLKTNIDANLTGPDLRGYANYKKVYLTLRFKPYFYGLGANPLEGEDVEDSSSNAEEDRYTELEVPSCQVQQVSAGGFQLIFTEGPLAGKAAPTEVSQLLPRANVRILWRRVPKTWVCSSGNIPTKILAGQGRINDAEFFGFPKGTILLGDVAVGRYSYPWRYGGAEPSTMFDIAFSFMFADPYNPLGTKRGWNLQPAPAVTVQTEADGVPFYDARRAKSDGTADPTGPGLLATYDMRKLFEHPGYTRP